MLFALCFLGPSVSYADALSVEISFDEQLLLSQQSMHLSNELLNEWMKIKWRRGVFSFYIKANLEINIWRTLVKNLKQNLAAKSKIKFILIRSSQKDKKSPIHESFISIYGLEDSQRERLSEFINIKHKIDAFHPTQSSVRRLQNKEALYIRSSKPFGYFRGEVTDLRSLYGAEKKDTKDDLESEGFLLLKEDLIQKKSYVKELSSMTKKNLFIEKTPKPILRLPASTK